MDQSRTLQARFVKRGTLWASQWLEALLSCIPVIAQAPLPKGARAWLDLAVTQFAKFAIVLIMIRAALLQRPADNIRDRFQVARAFARHDVRARHRNSLRAAIGGRLRRAVKVRGSLQQRAHAIVRALRQQDQLLARVVRRMRRGLSRRISLHTRATETLACFAEFAGVAFTGVMSVSATGPRADTS